MKKSTFCFKRTAQRGAKSPIVYETIRTTPALAADLLENTEIVQGFTNRDVVRTKLNQYAGEIASGKWMDHTAEPIKLTWSQADGCYFAIDGQHRLKALITAGVPLLLDYAFNVPREVFRVTDVNEPRNVRSFLQIETGWHEGNKDVAPAVLFLWREDHLGDPMGTLSDGKRASSGVIFDETTKQYPDLHEFYISQKNTLLLLKRAKMGSISWWLYLFYRWNSISPETFSEVSGYIAAHAESRHSSLLMKNSAKKQARKVEMVPPPDCPRGLGPMTLALSIAIDACDAANMNNRERIITVMRSMVTAWNMIRAGKGRGTKSDFLKEMQSQKAKVGKSK